MKFHLSIFLLAAGLFAQQNATKPEDLCGIEGQVTNLVTGTPVKKADLVLRRMDLVAKTAAQQTNYSATSDAGGKFAMQGIEPGNYQLTATGNGFLRVTYGARGPGRSGTTLSLDAGQQLKDVNFKLTPHAVIAGRIVDEDGDPVVGAAVQAQTYRRIDGRKLLAPAGGASTNDLGEYRIFGLAPGQYYLTATYNQPRTQPALRDSSTKPPPEEGYVPTYYPGSLDMAAAAALEVAPGAELRGMNIAIAKARTVRIRGHVNNPGDRTRQPAAVILSPRDQPGAFGGPGRSEVDAQGNFEIRGVRPGAYWLVAVTYHGDRAANARQAIDVGNTNVDDIVLTLIPGVELAGQIKAEGPEGTNLSNIFITLQVHAQAGVDYGPQPNGRVQDGGRFTLTQVSQDRYDVFVNGLPDGYYVKSIRAGDIEVRDSGLDMTSGSPGPLTVTIAPGAGQIQGVVLNDKQEPAAAALVALIPDDAQRRERRDSYHIAGTDQYGKFALKSIDPGEYKLYAWDDIESGAYSDPDFVKPFESQAVTMSIRENSRETAQLKLIKQ
jgi:protocatechuate 3,4-dioxygenase beta subunit